MKSTRKQWSHWLAVVLPALMAWGIPLQLWAADGEFDTPAQAISWYPKGAGIIHFKVKILNKNPNRAFKHGTFYVKNDKETCDVFYLGEDTSSPTSTVTTHVWNKMEDESLLYLTNDDEWQPLCGIWGENVFRPIRRITDGGECYAEFDWLYPARFAGQTFKFGLKGASIWEVGDGKEHTYTAGNKELGTIEFDDIMLETYEPIPGSDAENNNMLLVPLVSDHVINYVDAKYKNKLGQWVELPRTNLPKDSYSAFVRLPASEEHLALTITANVVAASISGSDTPPNNWPKSLSGNITKEIEKVGMIHAPLNFIAHLTTSGADAGSVMLTWKISDVDYEDILDGDAFQIQRSLTGHTEDFQDFAVVAYDAKQEKYSLKDSTLISALSAEQIDAELCVPNVRYRIRRASTEMWGWDRNVTAAWDSPQFRSLHLLKPVDATASWEDEEEHTVRLNWNYVPSDKNTVYVWDDRAEMSVFIQMHNRKGELVDSIVRPLTVEEINAQTLVLPLNRSCVNYHFNLRVDGSNSAIGNPKGDLFVKIRNTDDWNSFATRVNNGETKLDAYLLNQIGWFNNNDLQVGTEQHPYEGQFNGGSYSTMLKWSTTSQRYMAPFRYVANGALIHNVQTWGSIETNQKYASGIVANVSAGTVFIERCVADISIKSNVNGDGTHGEMVALVSSGAGVNIFNSYARSNMDGANTTNCAGFVGYNPETGFCRIVNGYTTNVGKTNLSGCCTFARNHPDGHFNMYITNSYYLYTYGTEQGINSSDVGNVYDALGWNDYPDYDDWPYFYPGPKLSSGEDKYEVVTTNKDKFYFEATGKIENRLVWTELQSSVLLQWGTDGNPIDFFEVMRRDKDNPTGWEVIATNITEMEYEDKKTSPVYTYIYKVRAANNCEGLSYTETEEVEAHCVQTGKAEGYVRFPDGTGIPDIDVYFTSQDMSKSISRSVKTDESGYYCIEGLPYYIKGTEALYHAAPDISGYTKVEPVTFGVEAGKNHVRNVTFEVDQCVKFSGYVMFDGTSIPVQGVRFLVDDHEVRNSSGAVESDFDGKFSFRVLSNRPHSIQAVKDGHTFWQDGYYYPTEDTSNKYSDFIADKGDVRFYDTKRVKLIGRIVGGRVQGSLPLDNSLSRNNLGDDLQMVLALEGDNVSRLVFDIQDRSLKERDTVFVHNAHDTKYAYQTKAHITQHRMEVTPDPYTGEYQLWLPPVKWKIQQITARGYPTLFQDGKTGDVIDLTDSLTWHEETVNGKWLSLGGNDVDKVVVGYHAQYNRIYHTPVQITYKQSGYDTFDYFGDKQYVAKNLGGTKSTVPLAYADEKTGETVYTFGHPVFNIERKYPFLISAHENYYWNNNQKSDTIDVVQMKGGVVTVQNGLVSSTHRETVELDDEGRGTVLIQAVQTPYLLTGEMALRTITMTLELDGTHYEATPLRAYMLNVYSKEGAKDILNYETPQLVDILRDPPGGTSSAKLSKGSSLKYSYSMDMSWKAGVTIGLTVGSSLNSFTGVVAAPMGAGGVGGFNNMASSDFSTSLDLIWSGSGNRAFSYTMKANEDISTSSHTKLIGADADLYIGVEQNIVVKPAMAIRALPDSVFILMGGEQKAGRMVEIANGLGQDGKLYHLVREEVLSYGPVMKSSFVHSQDYIVRQLIPSLVEQCRSLMYTGTETEAQAQANATGKPVYLSLLPKDSEDFGTINLYDGKYVYNSSKKPNPKANSYKIILPEDMTDEGVDEVSRYNNNMLAWVEMIAQNEREKLNATELVQRFDVDGAGSVSYGEEFSSDYSCMNSFTSPISAMLNSYFDNTGADAALGIVQVVGPVVAKFLGSILSTKAGGTQGATGTGVNSVEIECIGTTFKFSLVPALAFNVVPKHTEAKSYSRKESFSISMDRRSHLAFDVYRVKTATDDVQSTGVMDVFTSDNFYDLVNYDETYLKREMDMKDIQYARSFVYRTRAGATCRPYEKERKTIFYRSGTVLDEATKKIENPKIWLDRQSVSGVPYGEPARFTINLTNDSEQPEAAYTDFYLSLDESSNPRGAQVLIDGMPMSSAGRIIFVQPGEVVTKTMEVYAGEDFDYENLRIRVASTSDLLVSLAEAQFSVHYLRTAGNVDIAMPGDKWIMNTDAPYDKERGWHMPVVISGFDKNQKNFDHIEFQYKESNRGDDYWTNLCAFYADSTFYREASGTKAMIPENGNITTDFYGEGVVMEKAYDLRAVLFCRNGNDYLTNASKVLSGVKDTRRPQLFGVPDPKDGILGAGDNIIFNFSEPIEYNYLQATTNFEVKGETNETSIHEEPSLQFRGSGYAQSEARRNFADKNVTIEVMVKPDNTGKPMPIFSHGVYGKRLQLWLTEDLRLKAVVDDKELVSEEQLEPDGFRQVALVLDNDLQKLRLFGPGFECELDDVTYSGYGPIIFGSTNQTDVSKRDFYKGRMLQGRIWNRVMDRTLLNYYGNQLLTGYEMGLTDYYPMNEGAGKYAADEAQGAHLQLNGASWALPRGMSLRVDYSEPREVKGIKLIPKFFSRTSEDDYTLMFWFKTDVDGRGALLSNGSGRKTDVGAKERFFIGFEGDTLKYRSNGREFPLGNTFSDDDWHHYAMTVNRSHQVANVYIDSQLRASFSTDSLGGMSGDDFYIGNMVWHEDGPNKDILHQENALTGNLDGICIFEQALPVTLISRYRSKSVSGEEMGLKTFLGFNRQELQKNGELSLAPDILNQKINIVDGVKTELRDTVFAETAEYMLNHIDRDMGAPMQAFLDLRMLNFSYVGRDNSLLVNIDELDSRINKRTVYVTVMDVPDMNGNAMKSPATVGVFVDRNPLRWTQKIYKTNMVYDPEADFEFSVGIINNSGAAHTYRIANMPKWLSAETMSDIVEPKGEQYIKFSIHRDTNVGSYDNTIYLVDESGLAEPLLLNINVEGNMPEWKVDPELKQFSMSIVARVQIHDDIVVNPLDVVGVFNEFGECLGRANVNYNSESGEALTYLTVYDNNTSYEDLRFGLWHYSTGKIMVLQPSQPVRFGANSIIGTAKEPLILRADDQFLQQLPLEKGWNWISFNVMSEDFNNVEELLNQYRWETGDMLTDETNTMVLKYQNGNWISNVGGDLSKIKLNVGYSYRMKVNSDRLMVIMGEALKQPIQRTIRVKTGWNSIGYTPMVNLPVATALADYFDEAREGDVVKSKTEFAIFTTGDNNSAEWRGNLQYMKPGQGYMLYRHKESNVSFKYPYYEPNATFFESSNTYLDSNLGLLYVAQGGAQGNYANTMTLTAVAEGVELQAGDHLLAYSDGEVRGETVVAASALDEEEDNASPTIYISISGDKKSPIAFVVERDGEIIAASHEVMSFESNARVGTPNEPTPISFVASDHISKQGWFSTQGYKLQAKPQAKGVYIFNGKKQVVK